MISVTIPIRIRSHGNDSRHWSKSCGEKRRQKDVVRMVMSLNVKDLNRHGKLSATVVLTRIAPRSLDDDNLRAALKHVRDALAGLLMPEKVRTYIRKGKVVRNEGGCDDGDSITWQYAQEKAGPRVYALRIEIKINPRDSANGI